MTSNTAALPHSMRAFRVTGYGTDPAAILTEASVPLPSLASEASQSCLAVAGASKTKPSDRILVRVVASALNPLDTKLARGMAKAMMSIRFPLTAGADFSGVVVSVPEGLDTTLKPGDRVAGSLASQERVVNGEGTFTEFVTPHVNHVVRIPDSLSFVEAAGIGIVACTVWQSFVGQLGITPPAEGETKSPAADGRKILILGGSTACGLVATQLARAWGFADITVTSSQEALCKQYGATRVIDHHAARDDESKAWWNVLKDEGFDVLYNTAEGRVAWDKCGGGVLKGSRAGGRYNTLVPDHPDLDFTIPMAVRTVGALLWRTPLKFLGYPAFSIALDTKTGPGIAECVTLVEAGTLRFPVDKRGPFPATIESMREMWAIQHAGTARGKLVMQWE